MGERSLHSQWNWLNDQLQNCRESKKADEEILAEAQKAVDEAANSISEAEKAWKKEKYHRDMVLIRISHCDSRIGDLEAEMRLVDRKLAELRVNDLAERPEPHG